jgi:hypothetical protein
VANRLGDIEEITGSIPVPLTMLFILKVTALLYVIGFFATIVILLGKDVTYRTKITIVTAGMILMLAAGWPYYGYQHVISLSWNRTYSGGDHGEKQEDEDEDNVR